MYGLIGRITSTTGDREALIEILLENAADMPGCRSYVVARDRAHPSIIWITEVWDDQASHKASLDLPEVRDAIARARPLIAVFDRPTVTEPVDGYGLASR